MHSLDRSVAYAGTAWGVDPATHQVVVSVDTTVTGSHFAAVRLAVRQLGTAARLQTLAGAFTSTFPAVMRFTARGSAARSASNLVRGSTHYFLTAGHCGKAKRRWWTSANHARFLGNTAGATFPGKDYAIVRYNPSYTNHLGTAGSQDITHAANAFVGESVTRRCSTTGVHTRRVTALHVTVQYSSGATVRGLIQTNVCAEPRDSGGPLYNRTAALGLTWGGSGNCGTGGTTFLQPVTAALSADGVQVY